MHVKQSMKYNLSMNFSSWIHLSRKFYLRGNDFMAEAHLVRMTIAIESTAAKV